MAHCGNLNCVDCQREYAKLLRPKRSEPVTVPGLTTPTREKLEKHATRYGPGMVAETAAELGIAVTVAKPERKLKLGRTGPTLRERIKAHLEEGRDVDFIAEMENLNRSRARRLVAELAGENNDAA